jgi:hypothetical protein
MAKRAVKLPSLSIARPRAEHIGQRVYFHEDHVCRDGVCEYQPHDKPAIILALEMQGHKKWMDAIIVDMEGDRKAVSTCDLFWRRRPGVRLVP